MISSLAAEYAKGGGNGASAGNGASGVETVVYSVDIDELAEVAVAHDVSTLPRLLFFKVTRPPTPLVLALLYINPSHDVSTLPRLLFFKVTPSLGFRYKLYFKTNCIYMLTPSLLLVLYCPLLHIC